MINDWYYKTIWRMNLISHTNLLAGGPAPPGDTILINGTNKSPSGTGSYNKVKITKGKKYRLRLINGSIDANIRVSLDGHPFTVITADFVPVKTYTANWLLLAIGQRYDVIIYANNTIGNYWFRAEPATQCTSRNGYFGRSIFSYEGAPDADPTTNVLAPIPTTCKEEGPLTPWVVNNVPSDAFVSQARNLNVDLHVTQVTTNGQNIVFWGVNMTAIDIDWRQPTLQYVFDGNTSYPTSYNLIEIPNGQTWTYWIIQETQGTIAPIPHPIHL